jgi:dTDP-4-dehydrorhamnose reductase
LGRALVRSAPAKSYVVPLDRKQLDIEDLDAVSAALQSLKPDVLINTAAYTAVDTAESEPQRALAINCHAVRQLAQQCAQRRIKLLHISTDFVFDGMGSTPYLPGALANPVNAYGMSKHQGECAITALPGLDYRIVRTAWLYDETARNFVTTMLRLFAERPRVMVVADQVGTPTSAHSLAAFLWCLALEEGAPAVLHFTDAGVASWYDFAIAIREEATQLGLLTRDVPVLPITSAEYPLSARRPAFSVLDKMQTWQRLQWVPTHWRIELRKVLARKKM